MIIADPLLLAGFDKPVSRQLLIILSLPNKKKSQAESSNQHQTQKV